MSYRISIMELEHPQDKDAAKPQREVYTQTVDDLDLRSIIAAINGMTVVAQRRRSNKKDQP